MISNPESSGREQRSRLEDVEICYPPCLRDVLACDPNRTKFSLAWLETTGIATTSYPNLSTQCKRPLLPG